MLQRQKQLHAPVAPLGRLVDLPDLLPRLPVPAGALLGLEGLLETKLVLRVSSLPVHISISPRQKERGGGEKRRG